MRRRSALQVLDGFDMTAARELAGVSSKSQLVIRRLEREARATVLADLRDDDDEVDEAATRRLKALTASAASIDVAAIPLFKPYVAGVTNRSGPTYGHRPRSASRVFNPVGMSISAQREGRDAAEKPTKSLSCAELRALLKPSGEGQGHAPRAAALAATKSAASAGDLAATLFAETHAEADRAAALFGRKTGRRTRRQEPEVVVAAEWDSSFAASRAPPRREARDGPGNVDTVQARIAKMRQQSAGVVPGPWCDDRQRQDRDDMAASGLVARRPDLDPNPVTPRTRDSMHTVGELLRTERRRQAKCRALELAAAQRAVFDRIPVVKPVYVSRRYAPGR